MTQTITKEFKNHLIEIAGDKMTQCNMNGKHVFSTACEFQMILEVA